jgi:hydroxyethylthiazole kinase-like uncharacterized protein yjeF
MVAALAPICRTAEIRAVEAAARGLPLMERAGRAAAEIACTLAGDTSGAVLVLAGPGNNGGDAFVVARWLRGWFHDTVVVFRGDATRLPRDAAAAHAAYVAAGGATVAAMPSGWRGALVVDGLYGVGLARPLAAADAALVAAVNGLGVPILALDVPSGLDAETGTSAGAVIDATATATFIALKPGLVTGGGVDRCGAVSVHALGLEREAAAAATGHLVTWPALAAALPAVLRRATRDVHKGSFGTLGIVGGADGMLGAVLIAGRAALLTGAGKVLVGFAAPAHPGVDGAQPELMLRTADSVLGSGAGVIVCGPGLGPAATSAHFVARALAQDAVLVLDADALNVIAADAGLARATAARTAPTLITPHPAEAARLLGTTTAAVQADRVGAALALAARCNAATVLKGAGSVLAYPDGSWDVNASGNPGLASAGTGDALAGMLGALLAQGLDAKSALRLAVCLHGAAADALVAGGRGPVGLTAGELAPAARDLLNAAAR